MSIFRNLLGTLNSYFRIGRTGARLKDSSGVLEVRDSGDTAYAITRVATPVGANDATTKAYVDALTAVSAIKVIELPVTTTTANSVANIPANANILRAQLKITTPYDNAATINLGDSNSANRYLETALIDSAVADHTIKDQWTDAHTVAVPFRATVGNSPTVGAAVAILEYVETPIA